VQQLDRDIFAGIPRERNLDSVQSCGTVGNGFHANGNSREWFAICSWCCTDGADSSVKHPHKECEQHVKQWTRLVPAVSRD